jgi:hypothetical protein
MDSQTSTLNIEHQYYSLINPTFFCQGVWIYMENQNNGKAFSKAEQAKWNAQKKIETDMKK